MTLYVPPQGKAGSYGTLEISDASGVGIWTDHYEGGVAQSPTYPPGAGFSYILHAPPHVEIWASAASGILGGGSVYTSATMGLLPNQLYSVRILASMTDTGFFSGAVLKVIGTTEVDVGFQNTQTWNETEIKSKPDGTIDLKVGAFSFPTSYANIITINGIEIWSVDPLAVAPGGTGVLGVDWLGVELVRPAMYGISGIWPRKNLLWRVARPVWVRKNLMWREATAVWERRDLEWRLAYTK